MDAVTLVAAAVAIAVDQSRNAALEDIMQERERQAMHAAGLESMVAQRMYTANMQLPQQPGAAPMTWRGAHTRAHNEIVDMQDAVDRAARALRMGRIQQATQLLEEELRAGLLESDSSEPADSDASSLPAEPADSDAESEPDEQMLAEPDEQMLAELDEQMLAEPEEQVLRRCAGCGCMSADFFEQPGEDHVLCPDCEMADL